MSNAHNNDAEKRALESLDKQLNKENADNLAEGVSSLEPTTSLGRTERIDYSKEEVNEVERKYGWHPLWPENFPSKGRYYPEGSKFYIKAATVNEIRYFSTIDEQDPYSVEEAISDLLKVCLKISFPGRQASWKDLKEEDKINVILSIRELTFAEGENKLAFKVTCSSCGKENEMEIANQNFQPRELDESILKYYSESNRRFEVQTKSYGVINLAPPSIGIMKAVSDYIKELHKAGAPMKDAMPFLKVLPYLADQWRGLSVEKINHLKVEFTRFESKKFQLFTKLTEKVQISVKEKMMKQCESCDEPIEAEVQLPTGIRGLFIDDSIIDDELI